MTTNWQRVTDPAWCNDPKPANWRDACMRPPGHEGLHATRKDYQRNECFTWPDGPHGPVLWTYAEKYPDLGHAPEPKDKVVDLMAALEESIAAAKASRKGTTDDR